VFPVKYGQTYRVELSFKQNTGQWIMSRIIVVMLTCHRYKPIDLELKQLKVKSTTVYIFVRR
jgi:hypothetical protein